jgi:hypothetical protein
MTNDNGPEVNAPPPGTEEPENEVGNPVKEPRNHFMPSEEGAFGWFAVRVVRFINACDLIEDTDLALLIYYTLCFIAANRKKSKFRASKAVISKLCGRGKSTVQKGILQLERARIIGIRRVHNLKKREWEVNEYVLYGMSALSGSRNTQPRPPGNPGGRSKKTGVNSDRKKKDERSEYPSEDNGARSHAAHAGGVADVSSAKSNVGMNEP